MVSFVCHKDTPSASNPYSLIPNSIYIYSKPTNVLSTNTTTSPPSRGAQHIPSYHHYY